MKIRPGIELANLTDIGCARANNEDYFGYAEPETDSEFQLRGRLIIIADGMGGHEGGQVASALAVNVLRQIFLEGPPGDPTSVLESAFLSAHATIQGQAIEHPELKGMGTTCTAALLRDGSLTYGHVGDSRLYLLRDGVIQRLTRDHSYVQQLIDAGVITPEQAKTHPGRNILTSALGAESAAPADIAETPMALQAEDILLMCTDGLHGLATDHEMAAIASQNKPPEACRRLVDLAKSRGGFDNITLQIVRIDGPGNPSTP
ncbi:MAG: Stp1/IreP family PP2C-type Ser/Thr phosphatase [Candidatus Acidiferrales bacterium]